MTLGGAAQVAAHCPNERTLDPAVCSYYNRPTYAPASQFLIKKCQKYSNVTDAVKQDLRNNLHVKLIYALFSKKD